MCELWASTSLLAAGPEWGLEGRGNVSMKTEGSFARHRGSVVIADEELSSFA